MAGAFALRRIIKIVVGLVVVLALVGIGAVGMLVLGAAKPDHSVGFEQVMVRDPQDAPLEVGIWYPTDASPAMSLIGLSVQRVSSNGAVVGNNLPLIVISHGNGGLLSSHADTALALASAGFVVAAVTHTGDNVEDQRYVGTARWLIDRRDIFTCCSTTCLTSGPHKRSLTPRESACSVSRREDSPRLLPWAASRTSRGSVRIAKRGRSLRVRCGHSFQRCRSRQAHGCMGRVSKWRSLPHLDTASRSSLLDCRR